MKLFFFIIFVFILLACEKSDNKAEKPVKENVNNVGQTEVSDFKINEEVNQESKTEKYIEVENKKLIAPKELFEFYPKSYKGVEVKRNSSGNTSSELGRYTTSVATIEMDKKLIRLTLSDYFGTKYFPNYKYFKNPPKDNSTYTFKKIEKNDNIEVLIQWHRVNDEGRIDILLYDRFNLQLDVADYPDFQDEYWDLVSKFDLRKLKEISSYNE